MAFLMRSQPVDRAARDHAATVVASIIDRTIAWDAVPDALGTYTGKDRAVGVIHAELRSVSHDAASGMIGVDEQMDEDLRAVLERTQRFLRSDCVYRWHDRGPVEIVGAYLGLAALAWVAVAGAGAIWGFGHEAVIAGALFAMLLMYVMAFAMAVALMRRLWWRLTARREGADYRVWPFFTREEYRAAGGGAGAGDDA